MRIIKRYENRCLYDTELSSNITTQDLRQYVADSIPFKVINAKTEEDLTRQYLVQIILELETLDNPFFSQQSLEQIIRMYGEPLRNWFQEYMEQSLATLAKQQNVHSIPNVQEFMQSMTKFTEDNISTWQGMWGVHRKPKT